MKADQESRIPGARLATGVRFGAIPSLGIPLASFGTPAMLAVGGAFLIVVVAAGFRSSRVSLILTADAVVVTNAVKTRRVPLSELKQVAIRSSLLNGGYQMIVLMYGNNKSIVLDGSTAPRGSDRQQGLLRKLRNLVP